MRSWKNIWNSFMENGMGKDSFLYITTEGVPDISVLDHLVELYETIFDDADIVFFKKRMTEHPDLLSILVYNKEQLIGFKIGYRYDKDTFYSWIGGVKRSFRQNGIATVLAEMQEQNVKQRGYLKIRTKSMNRFKSMMVFNINNGFDIIQVYTNKKGQTKIIFEKSLSQTT